MASIIGKKINIGLLLQKLLLWNIRNFHEMFLEWSSRKCTKNQRWPWTKIFLFRI